MRLTDPVTGALPDTGGAPARNLLRVGLRLSGSAALAALLGLGGCKPKHEFCHL